MQVADASGGDPQVLPGSAVRSRPAAAGRLRGRRDALVRRTLLAADVVALTLAYAVAVVAHDLVSSGNSSFLLALLLSVPVWVVAAHFSGLYAGDDRRPEHSTLDELGPIFQLVTTASWISFAAMWGIAGRLPVATALWFWAAAVVLVACGRVAARKAVRQRPGYRQNTLIVGAGDVGQLVARKLVQHPEFGLRVLGFVDARPRELRADLEGLPMLGGPEEIVELVHRHGADRVVVAFSNDRHDLLVDLVRSLRDLHVQIDVVPRLFEAVGPVAGLHVVEGLPLVGLPPARPSRLARWAKRTVDVVAASLLLAVLSPLFAWIAWRIKRDSRGPVFFRQVRLGEGQKPFTVLKFRTMDAGADDAPHREYVRKIMDVGAAPEESNLYKLDRGNDVTRVGAWLRRTSLDELPQLVNVLRGEMSLVGPRPCLSYETELFEPHHFDRFLVPAGMTGLWQVAARARATMKEALDLDAAYARSWSFALDLSLLARTPLALARGKATR